LAYCIFDLLVKQISLNDTNKRLTFKCLLQVYTKFGTDPGKLTKVMVDSIRILDIRWHILQVSGFTKDKLYEMVSEGTYIQVSTIASYPALQADF
jgi:hypothetical protein